MHFVLVLLAAIISTLVWYKHKKSNEKEPLKLIAIVYMYSGASLMWLGDLIVGFVKEGSAIFFPGEDATVETWSLFFHQSLNDLFLGFATIVLGLLIWLIILLISDPKGIFKKKSDK